MSTDTETEGQARAGVPRRALALGSALVAVVVVVVVLVLVRGGDDDTVPYEDPQAVGRITLCDADGHRVEGGKVDDKPFADYALGETGVPERFTAEGATATLFAYQPRKGIAPSEYSGYPISAAAHYADPGLPATRVTEDAWSVGDFVTAFPAEQDGYVQLRIYLALPGAGVLTTEPYDALDLRVDGDEWRVVSGGTASCSKASTALEPTR
jgi:hypothetical protein